MRELRNGDSYISDFRRAKRMNTVKPRMRIISSTPNSRRLLRRKLRHHLLVLPLFDSRGRQLSGWDG
jgi:hypothetical protein